MMPRPSQTAHQSSFFQSAEIPSRSLMPILPPIAAANSFANLADQTTAQREILSVRLRLL